MVIKQIRVEHCDLGRFDECACECLDDVAVIVYLHHFHQSVHDLVLVECGMHHAEVHEELEEVNQVEQDLLHECVVAFFVVVLEERGARAEYALVVLRSLEQLVVVHLLHYHDHHTHQIVETQVLLGLFIGLQHELEQGLQGLWRGYVLDELEVGQDLYRLVPDGLGEGGLVDVQDLQDVVRDILVDLVQVLGH